MLAVCVFFLLGGHRAAMAGLLDSFHAIPPGSGAAPRSLAEGLSTLVGQSFSLGIRAAAPALTALMLATLVLGLIGRTLPQLKRAGGWPWDEFAIGRRLAGRYARHRRLGVCRSDSPGAGDRARIAQGRRCKRNGFRFARPEALGME